MATRTWSGAVDTDINNPLNYSGAGSLLVTDDLLYNAGAINAVLSSVLAVNSIVTAVGWTGKFDTAGYAFGTVTDCLFDHAGDLTVDSRFTMSGDGTLEISSNVLTLDLSDAIWRLEGDDFVTFGKTVPLPGDHYGSLEVGSTGKTVKRIFPEANKVAFDHVEFIGSGHIEWAGSTSIKSLTPFVNTLGTFTNLTGVTVLAPSNAGTLIFNVNDNIIANLEFSFSKSITVEQMGNCCLVNRFYLNVTTGSPSRTCVYNTNDYAITVIKRLPKINNYFALRCGGISGSNTLRFIAGTSVINTTNFLVSQDTSKGLTFDMDDCELHVSEDIIINISTGEYTQNYGNSKLYLDGSIFDQTVLSAGAKFNELIVDKASGLGNVQFLDRSQFVSYDLDTTIIQWKDGVIHSLDSYVSGDIDDTTWESTLAGAQAIFDNPAGMVVSGVSVKDNQALLDIDAFSNINIDSGNNSPEWLFFNPTDRTHKGVQIPASLHKNVVTKYTYDVNPRGHRDKTFELFTAKG